MAEFIGNLIIFIGVVWLVGWVVRMLFRYWIARKMGEFAREAGASGSAQSRSGSGRGSRKEGEVHIDGADPAASRKVRRDVGEYVDFEEVKEDKKEE